MRTLLTIKEVADRLQVSPLTVRSWQRKRIITFVKLPQGIRIPEEWLNEWIKRRTIKSK